MTKEEAASAVDQTYPGFAYYRVLNQPSKPVFWHESGRAWRGIGPKLVELTQDQIGRLPQSGWVSGFPNSHWAVAVTKSDLL